MTAEVPECHESFHANGKLQMRWFRVNDKLHRTDGPACEHWDAGGRLDQRQFWVNGKLHRTGGPALELWKTYGSPIRAFWVNGKRMTEEDFLAWQRQQRELAALVFALEHKFPAEVPEREFLRHILPAFVAGGSGHLN